jgi:hypothetical protein
VSHERRVPTRERLVEFLAAHPNAEGHLYLSDIARELGVSRERVRQLLPGWQGPPSPARALELYLAAHPEAMMSAARGGMTMKAIALAIGREASAVRRAWLQLGLPDRRSMALSPREKSRRQYNRNPAKHRAHVQNWSLAHPEQVREIARAARRRWLAKVIGEEVCVICGVSFPWTNMREKRRRRRGGRVVCSQLCGARARAQALRAATPGPR